MSLYRKNTQFAARDTITFGTVLKKYCRLIPLWLIAALVPAASANVVDLAWDPVNDPRVAIYQVQVGTASGQYDRRIDTTASVAKVESLDNGGTYFFAVRACDANLSQCSGFSNEVSKTFPVVTNDPPPTAGFSTATTRGEAPLTVLFTDTSTGEITAREWGFGDGGTATNGRQVTHTYTQPGTYSVQLSVTGPGGTDDYVATDLIVVQAPSIDGGGDSSGGDGDDSDTGGPGDGVQPVVAYWPLDASGGTLVADQQNANDLILNGPQWQPSSGQMDGALYFDGANDYAEASDASLSAEIPSSSSDNTGDFTLAAWINPERLNDRQPILSKQGTTASGPARGFVFSAGASDGSGKLYFETFADETSSGKTSLTSNQALEVGEWQHVAVTYRYVADGSSVIILYINGEEVGRSDAAVGPLQANFQPLDLGRYYWSSGYQRYFKGLIDEVYVFAEVLSPTELHDLASNGLSETPVNRAPEAVDDTATVAEGSTGNNLTVLSNDTDADGDALTVTSANASNGTVSINTNGTLDYTPKANFHGTDTVTYEIDDGVGGTATATVTISVTAVNDAPQAGDDEATVVEGSTDNILTVLSNDTDADGDALTVSSASAANGTVTINANGTLSYTPNANFHGTDTLTYEINDGEGGTDTATVTITVTEVHDKPVASFSTATTRGEAPLTVLFTDTSTGEVTTRNWEFGDGGTATEARQVTHTYTEPGTYSVQLSVTGPGGTDEILATDLIVVVAPTDGGGGSSGGGGDSGTGGPGDDAQIVAYWPLDAGSGTLVADQQDINDMTLNGPQWQPNLGQVDGALHFDGINDYAEASDADVSAAIPGSSWDSTGDFTLAAWINPERLNDRQPILSKQGRTMNGPRRGFVFSAGESNGSGKLYFEVFADDTSSGKTSLTSTQALTVGEWQHVAVTYRYVADGRSVITLYINGEEVGHTDAAVGPVQANFQPLDLGRYYWSSSYQRYFQGLIDEVYVFGEVLSPTDIQDLVERASDDQNVDTQVVDDSKVAIDFGEISLDHEWIRVDFQREFDEPVVIVGPPSGNGSDPAVVRVDAVDGNGFWVRIQEWGYLDDSHVNETVSYMVMERGVHELPNGTWIEAGHVDANDGSFVATDFTASFVDAPVVLTTVATLNEQEAVTTRLRNINQNGFEVKLQEQEANLQQHASERIAYIAWEPSAGELEGLRFEVRRTGDVVTHKAHTISYSTIFNQAPSFLVDLQSTDGGDTANLRWDYLSSTSVDVWVDEEQSRDSEIRHTTETVGYIAITTVP